MSKFLDLYVKEKRVDEKLSSQLHGLLKESPELLGILVEDLAPSANTMRQILECAAEIGQRDGSSISRVLENAMKDIGGASRKEKQAELRRSLECLRYPIKTKVLEKAEELKRTLQGQYGVKVELPEDLEGDQVQVSLRIRSSEDLGNYLPRLARLAKDKNLDELFCLMLGKGLFELVDAREV